MKEHIYKFAIIFAKFARAWLEAQKKRIPFGIPTLKKHI